MSDLWYSETGPRFSQWLRDVAYPGQHKAKRIASEWDFSVSLAKFLLSGGRPGPDILDRMKEKWRKPFIDFLYSHLYSSAPYDGAALAKTRQDVSRRLDLLRASCNGENDNETAMATNETAMAAVVRQVAREASHASVSMARGQSGAMGPDHQGSSVKTKLLHWLGREGERAE